MNLNSVSDLARSFHLRHATAKTTKELHTLNQELSSGRKADIATSTRGDLSKLNQIQSQLAKADGLIIAGKEAATLAQSMQTVLKQVREDATSLSSRFLGLSSARTPETTKILLAEALPQLSSTIATLNTDVGGQFILGGTATDRPPLVPGSELLSKVKTAISGLQTIDEIKDKINEYFNAPSAEDGFAKDIYRGTKQGLNPMQTGLDAPVTLNATAADDGVKDILKGLTLAALMADGTIADDPAATPALIRQAGLWLANGATKTTLVQGQIGKAEERIEQISVQAQSERGALMMGFNAITSADPYETAAKLTEAENKMQLVYTLTARLSRLTLANFLK